MPDFLAALLTFVLSFAQSGQPASTPPNIQEDVAGRGNEVSQIAGSINPQESIGVSAPVAVVEPQNNQTPDTERVKAYNVKAEIPMPAQIPQVAVDKSPALENASPLITSDRVIYTLPEASENSEFGQDIAVSVPENAQTDGKTFGEETGDLAKDNSRRP